MRKIAFYGAISLDGFLADKNDNLDWLFNTHTEGEITYDKFIETVDTVVMGRVTYEEVLKLLKEDEEFYPNQEKIIFSNTLKNDIEDVKVVQGNVVDYLNKLRQKEGKTIWIIGGSAILKPLVEANMVDDYYIQIAPILLGDGKRLFEKMSHPTNLKYLGTSQMGDLVEVRYSKIRL